MIVGGLPQNKTSAPRATRLPGPFFGRCNGIRVLFRPCVGIVTSARARWGTQRTPTHGGRRLPQKGQPFAVVSTIWRNLKKSCEMWNYETFCHFWVLQSQYRFSRNSDDRNLNQMDHDGSGVGFSRKSDFQFAHPKPLRHRRHHSGATHWIWMRWRRTVSAAPRRRDTWGEKKNESTCTTKAYMAYNKRVQSIYLSIYVYM